MLVDEGKIRWEAPVIDYLPEFQMFDPAVSREITVRDLLCHRCGLGLGAGDLMLWPASDLNRKEILRRVRYIKTGQLLPNNLCLQQHHVCGGR